MVGPDVDFWQERFLRQQTPWDRGDAHPQLRDWLQTGLLSSSNVDGALGVPGCGAGHEVALLAAHGFDVTALDYAPAAVELTRRRLAAVGAQAAVLTADVLTWSPAAPLGAVYEQTCLCALHPDRWVAYAARLHAWLLPGSRLFALFMQARAHRAAQGFIDGPPYDCPINAMRSLFAEPNWKWPAPPYPRAPHPMGNHELAVVLTRV